MVHDDFPVEDSDPDVLTSARGDVPGTGPQKQVPTSGNGSQPQGSQGPRHSLKPSSTGGMKAVQGPPPGGQPVHDTGGHRAHDTGGHRPHNTGAQPAQNRDGPQSHDTGGFGAQGSNTGGFGAQSPPGGRTVPESGGMQRPITGTQPAQEPAGFRKDTSGFVPVKARPEPEEIDFQLRIIYAGSGFGIGLMLGVGLGLLNSALQGVEPMAGLGLTLQIAVWLGLIIGIVAGWKPRRFDTAWERLTGGLGLDD